MNEYLIIISYIINQLLQEATVIKHRIGFILICANIDEGSESGMF